MVGILGGVSLQGLLRRLCSAATGARFDAEWGGMNAFGNSTRGDWREQLYEDVVDAIETIAGNPDLSVAEDYEKRARAAR